MAAPETDEQGAEGGAENVDKIRDILFGAHMREYDQRFAALEQKLGGELRSLRSDTEKRLEKLETFLSKRVEELQQQLHEERKERAAAAEGLAQQARGDKKELGDALSAADAKFSAKSEEAAQQLHSSFKELMQHVTQVREELVGSLERESSQLKQQKVNREDLSVLLTNLALNLAEDAQPPRSGD